MLNKANRIKYIDALKFLAIAGVFFLHCFNIVTCNGKRHQFI